MELTAADFAWALLWSAVAGFGAWVLLWPLRRHSLTGLLAALVMTGAAASVGAFVGGIRSMLLPGADWATVTVLLAFAGAVAAVAAVAAARRIARDKRVLRAAVADVGAGRVPSADGPPLTAELEQVRRELRDTATALAEARGRERALEVARRDLVSWVSHDLRTPLAGLRAMAEALEDGVVSAPEQYYKQIGASVDRLSGMVDDLFQLSRIQAGGMTAELESIALDDVVSDAIAALVPLASARAVTLTGAPGGGTTVAGNGRDLNRAVTNLIANAIRHTPDDGTVEVRVDIEPGVAVVAVEDECGGIPDADLPRLFEVGFRGEAARTSHVADSDGSTAGAGLGLAITRGIVEAHGGTVDAANTPRGCRFRVRLPIALVG